MGCGPQVLAPLRQRLDEDLILFSGTGGGAAVKGAGRVVAVRGEGELSGIAGGNDRGDCRSRLLGQVSDGRVLSVDRRGMEGLWSAWLVVGPLAVVVAGQAALAAGPASANVGLLVQLGAFPGTRGGLGRRARHPGGYAAPLDVWQGIDWCGKLAGARLLAPAGGSDGSHAWAVEHGRSKSWVAKTDRNGEYAREDVEPGECSVNAQAPGSRSTGGIPEFAVRTHGCGYGPVAMSAAERIAGHLVRSDGTPNQFGGCTTTA
jgi:hypothetical protein